jgi:prepilin-type N-terminal cleavage/methylation domain-containing protein
MFLALGQAGSLSAYQFRGVKTSRSSSRAFTLIELLVVIAIIAILAALHLLAQTVVLRWRWLRFDHQ